MVLISDYDGTLKRFKEDNIINNIDLKLDLKEIDNFIKDNNLFILATRRTTESIKKEIEKYKINFNYLITYDGAVILDRNNKYLYTNYINQEIINYIKTIPKYIIESINFYDEYGKTRYIDYKQYIKLLIRTKNSIEFMKYLKEIKNIEDIYFNYNNDNNYFTLRNITDKKTGVDNLMKTIQEIKKNNIVTVGDTYQDYSMLDEYNGYILSTKHSSYKNVPNIRTLIKAIK